MILSIFNFHVACVTQACEIVEEIRLLMVGEISKPFDVMHVQSFAKFLLSNAALLAGVIIPRPSAPFLPLPVSAVIGGGAATPSSPIFPAPVVRLPLTEATAIAIEMSLSLARSTVNQLVRLSLQHCATPIAYHLHRWNPSAIVGASLSIGTKGTFVCFRLGTIRIKSLDLALAMTCARAKSLALNFGLLNIEGFAASFTLFVDAIFCAHGYILPEYRGIVKQNRTATTGLVSHKRLLGVASQTRMFEVTQCA